MERPFAAAAERNSAAILGVLRREFHGSSAILEIGSGTGQHAIAFASELTELRWQPSDIAEAQPGIRAWVEYAALPNVLPPLTLDVTRSETPIAAYDGVFSANTSHIMSIEAVQRMFTLIANALIENGVFCLYGPFRLNGEFTTQSNADFHQSLRRQDSAMGIRDLEELDAFGDAGHLVRDRLYAMPANNFLGVWKKRARGVPA